MRLSPALSVAILFHALAVVTLPAQAPSTRASGPLPAAPGRIAGIVVSSESNQPLRTAAITVRSATDSLIVAGSLTAADGKFRIDGLAFGRYRVHVSLIGYKSSALSEFTLTPAAPVQELGAIRMVIEPITLPGLEAQGARAPLVLAADGTVYNTKDLPVSAGNALDVLRSVPELEVDINGRIALRGSQSVAIHLNGRPAPLRGDQLTNFLQQLPGNRLVKVEVLPNPSAKHDPEGMGGIINLVMRENVDLGSSGSVSGTGSTRLTQGLSGRFNYQSGPLTVFSSGAFTLSEEEAESHDVRQSLLARPVKTIEQNSYRASDAALYNVDVTAEWRLSRQSVLWASGWWYNRRADNRSLAAYGFLDESMTELEAYDRHATGGNDAHTTDASIGFKRVFQPQQHEFTVDLRVATGGNQTEIDLTREYLRYRGLEVSWPDLLTYSDIDARNNNVSLQADYIRPLGARGRLELGYRAWQRGETSDNMMEEIDQAESQDAIRYLRTGYDHDEVFHSLYALVSRSQGKLSLQAGVRAELANTTFAVPVTDERFENDYNSIFPSANLSYDLGQGRSARLSYAKRIGRPTPYLLNPSVPNDDEVNQYFGNPHLKPTYTHSFNLDLSWVGQRGVLRASPYYRKTVDNWDQLRMVDASGVSTMTWTNSASLQSFGAALSASLQPTGPLSASANLSAFREVRDATNIAPDYSQAALRWSASLNAAYQLRSTLSASTSMRYTPPVTLIQGRSESMFQSSIGLRQVFWDRKGSISVFANDPLDLFRFNFETRDLTHTQISRTTLKQRMLTLALSYNFGRPPEQNSRRQSDSEAAPGTMIR